MALITNKKNKIIAEWKAGVHKSYNSIAVQYKIDPKTVKKLLDGISQSNADIVEVGTMYEMAKKSIKNPNEIKAVEVAIQKKLTVEDYRDKVFDATGDILKGIHDFVKRGKAQKVVTSKMGTSIVDVELQAIDYKNAQETVTEAGRVFGVIERFAPKTEINNTNAQQNNDNQIEVVFK